MGRFSKVFKSFDYADITIDYKQKTVALTYPDKSSWFEEFLMFAIVGLLFYVPATFFTGLILSFWFDTNHWGVPLLLFFFISWMVFCYKSTYIRKKIIEAGQEANFNHIILTGNIKKRVVRLNNVGNYLTEYEATGDYKKYLEKFQIKCKKLDKKKNFLTGKTIRYHWQIILTFTRIPRVGQMIIRNQRGGLDEVKGNGIVNIAYD